MSERKDDTRGQQHRDAEMAEARTSTLETIGKSSLQEPLNGDLKLDPGATQGPGGDSRPDVVSPEGAEFTRVDDDQAATTDREPQDQPSLANAHDPEYVHRHEIDTEMIVAKPMAPLMEEGSEIRERHVDQKREGDKD